MTRTPLRVQLRELQLKPYVQPSIVCVACDRVIRQDQAFSVIARVYPTAPVLTISGQHFPCCPASTVTRAQV